MRCNPFHRIGRGGDRACAGFTLAEVLAALMFMAIVIPVTIEALRIANLAGQVAQRKAAAARIAERVLTELVVTGQWQSTTQDGVLEEGPYQYRWAMRLDPWNHAVLRLLTVEVTFEVQGQPYQVRLSRLLDTTVQ